jgi:predicted nucleotidyltransferase component of viral defense system
MVGLSQVKVRQAEIAQLIVLQAICSVKESREVIFQGGTAIRWFYGGTRFSEDLDFVAAQEISRMAALIRSAGEPIRRQLVANFGTGSFAVKEKKSRATSYKAFVDFLPSTARNKVSVKVEFEKLAPGALPDMDRRIMQASPAVSYVLREGGLKAPGVQNVVNVETPAEILTDKLRALMERPYTKGRDFFDVWFLTETLGLRADPNLLRRKLDMYETPFVVRTPLHLYSHLDSLDEGAKATLTAEIRRDLARFLDPETVEALELDEYKGLMGAVQKAFRLVEESGVIDFSKYSRQEKGALQE